MDDVTQSDSLNVFDGWQDVDFDEAFGPIAQAIPDDGPEHIVWDIRFAQRLCYALELVLQRGHAPLEELIPEAAEIHREAGGTDYYGSPYEP